MLTRAITPKLPTGKPGAHKTMDRGQVDAALREISGTE